MQISQTIPVLRIFDEQKAREFYIDFLGFSVTFVHRFGENAPIYLGLSFGGANLHLSEHHGDGCPGGRVRFETDNIEALHKRLTEQDYKFAKPGLEIQPWGFREISIADPFSNKIVFCQPDQTILDERQAH